MIRARRAISSVRKLSAWLVVGGGLVLYSAVVVGLDLARVSSSLPLPWWLAQAVPPIVYAILIRLCMRRVSVSRWMIATCSLWAVHVLLGVLTGALVASFGLSSVGFSIVEAFPPPVLPEIFWVPLLLVPLRDPIAGDPRAARIRETRRRQVATGLHGGAPAPAPSRPPVTAMTTQVGAAPAPVVPSAAPAQEHARSDMRWPPRSPRETGARPSPPGHGEAAGEQVTRAEAAREVVPARAVVERPPQRSNEMPGHDTSAAPVRVSFDRVAGQLPADAFHLPLDRIGASLPEPGYLLIPQRLVLAQLAEGFVRAGWEVVAEQFPRQSLAMSDEEIALRLTDGQLVLPLDELVPQLPHDLFVPTGGAVEVDGIESFPAPFQPTLAEAVGDAPAQPLVGEAQAAEWPASNADWPLGEEAGTGCEFTESSALEDVELDPVLTGLAQAGLDSTPLLETQSPPLHRGSADDVDNGGPPAGEGATASPPEPSREPIGAAPDPEERRDEIATEPRIAARGPIGDIGGGGPPARAGGSPPEPAREPSELEPECEQKRDEIATERRIAALLAPLNAFDVGVESVDGVRFLAVSPCGLSAGAAVAATKLLLPLLAEGHAPWAVNQLTLRGPDAVLILTPLGPLGRGGSVLVSAVPPGGALALVEILSLRAAADDGSDATGSPRVGEDTAEEGWEADLLDSEPPTRLHQIAATLGAIGPVIASVLHDVEAERDLYLFLPSGSDVRTAGRFAGELERAMRRAGDLGHAFHTAVLRCGRRRLIIRLERAATARPCIVVAGGDTERAGLAYRQVEDAARALGAR